MGRYRFVDPEVVRLPLTDGDWIEIKKDLTVEETKSLQTAGLRSMGNVAGGKPEDATIDVDWKAYALARANAYIVDWSFRNKQDKPVPVDRLAIASLDPVTFDEIENAISAYLEKRDAEKKVPPSSPTSATASTLPSGSESPTTT